MNVVVDRDPDYAPCGYLICKVDSTGKWDTRDDSTTVLVQSDWDYPSVASNLGWSPCHDCTDGTVDCPECGRTNSEMITDAADYLDNHLGEPFDGSDYFKET